MIRSCLLLLVALRGLCFAAAARRPGSLPRQSARPATRGSARPITPLAARNGARPTDRPPTGSPAGRSGPVFTRLPGGREALAARVVLAEAAEGRWTFSTTSGATTGPARSCSTRSAARPIAACVSGCCSTTTIPPARIRPARARSPPQHRGAAVQPVRAARRADGRLPDRLLAAEPAHAQQVVHRGQPGHHHRRAQHRRRYFDADRRARLRRPRRPGGRRDRRPGIDRLRPLLVERIGVSGGPSAEAGPRRRRWTA